jgi:hypothetical protein
MLGTDLRLAETSRRLALLRRPSRHGTTHSRVARRLCLGKVPTRPFAANALYLEVVRLAYNLVIAFQQACVPEAWQSDAEQLAA